MVHYTKYVRGSITRTEERELIEVDRLARGLRAHLESQRAQLAEGHIHGARSSVIQDLVAEHLVAERQFVSESTVLSGAAIQAKPRADFFGRLGEGRGIIVEVERGGTTTNNHDLKDVWKTHLAEDAHHLFLIVPEFNFRADGSQRERPYSAVVRRLAPFFGDPRREVDVLSAHIFGY
jgi:hypothetical protein